MATSNNAVDQEKGSEMTALKKKKELTKKSELLREIHKLDVQIQAMEREKLTHIYSKRSDFHREYVSLKEEEEKLTEERKTEKIRLQQQLEKLSLMVKKFHRELRDVKPTPEFVEKLKTIMDEIEGAINSFKEQQKKKYEDLMKVEKSLGQELQQIEKKFESWSQIKPAPFISLPKTNNNNVKEEFHNLPPEVAAFDEFVHQSGGHRGGWDEHDHQTFLRYRNMYKGRIVFLDHVKSMLPTRLETEIREHESWYQEYLFLNENKKHAIKKWREKKEERKEDAVSLAEKEDLDSDEEEKKKKAMEQVVARERADRFKKINAWRVQKELEKAMQEERKLKSELESAKQQEAERKRQLEVKKYVDEFRQQRQQEEEMLQMMEEERKRDEEERRRQTSARDLGRFRNRDLQKLHNKLEQEKEKEAAQLEKERKLQALKNQVRVQVVRDPNRLLRPTAGWKERMKAQGPEGGGQVLTMPHRAVPSWRQGMN